MTHGAGDASWDAPAAGAGGEIGRKLELQWYDKMIQNDASYKHISYVDFLMILWISMGLTKSYKDKDYYYTLYIDHVWLTVPDK